VIALAAWGLGSLGKSDNGPRNEPVDTSVRSEPVPEDKPLRLPGPASANAAEKKGTSSLSRPSDRKAGGPAPKTNTPANTPDGDRTLAMLPPPKTDPGTGGRGTPDEALVIKQGDGAGASDGPLGRALDQANQGATAPTTLTQPPGPNDPNVVTPLPNPVGTSGRDPAPSPGELGSDPAQPTNGVPQTPAQPVGEVATLQAAADDKIKSGDLVTARKLLSQALASKSASDTEKAALRQKLGAINEDLVFSPKLYPGDTYAETYTIASGDALAKIARKRELATDWRLIQRINRLSDPNKITVGQKLKLIRGPFHAVVTKSAYRLDLYMGSPDEPASWVFVKSYTVGLGEENGTPTGTFVVKKNSKLVNPYWVNPRTGEKFEADDPKNPIGEFWIGIEGVGESAPYVGYGLHGTIDPDSIGKQRSMGCVRMGAPDIAQVYELLIDGVSVVKIQP
jgi:lipoprotein-anchoring transpeptidase ErfK/SrfK